MFGVGKLNVPTGLTVVGFFGGLFNFLAGQARRISPTTPHAPFCYTTQGDTTFVRLPPTSVKTSTRTSAGVL